jgi:LuxR family maltose regulon positive regulatory protein
MAQQQAQASLHLAQQLETVGTPATCNVLLARVKLAQGDLSGAAVLLEQAEQFMRQRNFAQPFPEVVMAQVFVQLHQGRLTAAAHLAETHELPLSRARVYLAQGDPALALTVLAPHRQHVADKDWANELLKVLVLQALAHQAQGETDEAVQVLREALKLAEPAGFIRRFVDEGPPMATLLEEAVQQGIASTYVCQLQAAFGEVKEETAVPQLLIEPLTGRELEVLKLLQTELSGPEIAGELIVSLNTMRTHTKNIYSKLGVNSRRTAVRRAEELNLL